MEINGRNNNLSAGQKEIDGSGSQEIDMVISSKERDQSKEKSSESRDPALTVKFQIHRS